MRMMTRISFVLIGVTILQCTNGNIMDDLVDTLLKDPHTRGIIEDTKNKLQREQSPREVPKHFNSVHMAFRGGDQEIPPPPYVHRGDTNTVEKDIPPNSYVGGYRGGDALMQKNPVNDGPNPSDVPLNHAYSGFRAGDSSTSQQEDMLLDQLKNLLENTISKKDVLSSQKEIPSMKDLNNIDQEKAQSQRVRDMKEPPEPALPWKRQSWIPWKRELYNRIVSDINELFTMTDKEDSIRKRNIENQDRLSDDLSSLLKNIK